MNLTKLTEDYIQERTYIRACLKKGLINYSSLARLIANEKKIDKKSFDAVLIAIRRYREKIRLTDNEKEILELLSKSKLEVKNKIVAVVLESGIPSNTLETLEKKIRKSKSIFRLVESASAITLVTSEEHLEDITSMFRNNIIKKNEGLVEITLKTSKDIEKIPGVMSFLYSMFAEFGINIVETMSCWTDTIVIVEEKDIAKVMEIMRF